VRYVGRVIHLAFLAPDIVEAIVEGSRPSLLQKQSPGTSRSRSNGVSRRPF
jgi:hypothetical protein